MIRRQMAALITLVLSGLTGCIPVADLGESWDKGTVDPRLEGHWRALEPEDHTKDEFVSFVKTEKDYLFTHRRAQDPEPASSVPARTLTLGTHRFLMLRPDLAKPRGGVTRYAVEGETLILFGLKEEFLQKAVEKGEVAGDVSGPLGNDAPPITFASLSRLDKPTRTWLAAMAGKPGCWRENRYGRVRDLEAALARCRAYPATKDTPKNTLVQIQQPDLAYFGDGRADLLQRHLRCSPEWKVFNDLGQVVCYWREKKGDAWTVSLNGYRMDADRVQTRRVFRFHPKAGGPWARRLCFMAVGPTAGATHIRLRASDQGIKSYFAVGKPGLWFEFFEQRAQEPRTSTREALGWLRKTMAALREAEGEIGSRGFAPKQMPAKGVRRGKPSLRVSDGMQGGIYNVHAWVNPREPGVAYLKAFNVETGERLSEHRMFGRSNELVGWSANGEQLFLYNVHVTVYEGDWDHRYQARFELWFRPKTGKPERKLLETTREICGWEF